MPNTTPANYSALAADLRHAADTAGIDPIVLRAALRDSAAALESAASEMERLRAALEQVSALKDLKEYKSDFSFMGAPSREPESDGRVWAPMPHAMRDGLRYAARIADAALAAQPGAVCESEAK